jgi:hypothetical protein
VIITLTPCPADQLQGLRTSRRPRGRRTVRRQPADLLIGRRRRQRRGERQPPRSRSLVNHPSYFFRGNGGWGVSSPLCLSSSSTLHFSYYSFWVHQPVNWDDRHLLAHAIASDFSVTWKSFLIYYFSQRQRRVF